ncbi:hypothetical protein Taro_047241, partial [Colocasia esculenta]|nr:hypothetical protein [Colocasia esculenta]
MGARGGFGVNREISGGFLQGKRLKILASTSFVAKFISWDIDGQIPCRLLPCSVLGEFPTEPMTSEAHPYPHRRRTRIKYVIDLTGLAEAFRHRGCPGQTTQTSTVQHKYRDKPQANSLAHREPGHPTKE